MSALRDALAPRAGVEELTLLALGRLRDDELRRLQVGGRMHQHELLQVEILLLELLQLLQVLEQPKGDTGRRC